VLIASIYDGVDVSFGTLRCLLQAAHRAITGRAVDLGDQAPRGGFGLAEHRHQYSVLWGVALRWQHCAWV
jgi:hypothetical protein